MVKKALIHVENSDNLVELASFLVELGWTIYSANKTEEILKDNNIPVTTEHILSEQNIYGHETAQLINEIHSTRLSQETDQNLSTNSGSGGIFLLCLNIIPETTPISTEISYQKKSIPSSLQVSVILRDSFLNYQNIIILTDPDDYKEAMIQLRTGSVTSEFRSYLAAKALNMISAYDAGLSHALLQDNNYKEEFMNYLSFPLVKASELKHGSNKQQKAVLYRMPTTASNSTFYSELLYNDFDYNNISDLSSIWDEITFLYQTLKNQYSVKSVTRDGYNFTTQFTPITGTVFTIAVKYNTIIGAAISTNALDSFKNTYAYGNTISGVSLGCSSVVDKITAEEMVKCNFLAIVAPDFTDEAREVFAQNKNTKLVAASKFSGPKRELRMVNNVVLFQEIDSSVFEEWQIKTNERPSQYIVDEMAFGMILAMKAKSHCVILLKNNTITGIGQSCLTPKKAIDYALMEAKEKLTNNTNTGTIADLLVCDSTIGLSDSIKELVENGLSAIIQTGGDSTDDEFINYCNEHGIVMIFTNMNHITI